MSNLIAHWNYFLVIALMMIGFYAVIARGNMVKKMVGLTIFQTSAWFYPEGKHKAEYGEVDGVSGATTNWQQGKGERLELNHIDPTKQALIDFRDAILNNKPPLSTVTTGAKAAYAVEMGIQAMDQQKVIHWDDTKFIL